MMRLRLPRQRKSEPRGLATHGEAAFSNAPPSRPLIWQRPRPKSGHQRGGARRHLCAAISAIDRVAAAAQKRQAESLAQRLGEQPRRHNAALQVGLFRDLTNGVAEPVAGRGRRPKHRLRHICGCDRHHTPSSWCRARARSGSSIHAFFRQNWERDVARIAQVRDRPARQICNSFVLSALMGGYRRAMRSIGLSRYQGHRA